MAVSAQSCAADQATCDRIPDHVSARCCTGRPLQRGQVRMCVGEVGATVSETPTCGAPKGGGLGPEFPSVFSFSGPRGTVVQRRAAAKMSPSNGYKNIPHKTYDQKKNSFLLSQKSSEQKKRGVSGWVSFRDRGEMRRVSPGNTVYLVLLRKESLLFVCSATFQFSIFGWHCANGAKSAVGRFLVS